MVETLCNSGSVKLKAGTNVSTDITAEQYTELINQAESIINVDTRFDWVSNYSALDVEKKILEECCSAYAAVDAIGYDPDNYPSLETAELLMDKCWTKYKETVKILREKVNTDWLKEQTT